MAASISASLVRFQIKGHVRCMVKPWIVDSALRGTIGERSLILNRRVSGRRCTSCMLETAAFTNSQLLGDFGLGVMKILGMEEMTGNEMMNIMNGMLLGDIDPATAKVAISILGPVLSAFSFLFIIRIVMSWYPMLPVDKFPYVVAYAPTEPILVVTRKVIPLLGGVDVTPVVWFGLLSFANEILVGPQDLLVLLSQQV